MLDWERFSLVVFTEMSNTGKTMEDAILSIEKQGRFRGHSEGLKQGKKDRNGCFSEEFFDKRYFELFQKTRQ